MFVLRMFDVTWLVVIDKYLSLPITEIVKHTSMKSTIFIIDQIFSLHGTAEILKTDTTPPFNSRITKIAPHLSLVYRKITPLWPHSNELAGSFMKFESCIDTMYHWKILQQE